MIKRRNLRTQSIKLLVLDEADEMLNQGKDKEVFTCLSCTFIILKIVFLTGFQEQIYDVYRYLPPSTQVSDGMCVYVHVML